MATAMVIKSARPIDSVWFMIPNPALTSAGPQSRVLARLLRYGANVL